ncbi:MAG TPA: V-type ATPase 116kDa subunit family protein [Coriobacteriia bacterium]|nr:V-type ATPase 116kDa subunit family protein [Coriobacteriia bacterium]
MLVPMAKVEMIGPKNRFFDVVTLLHEMGTLHIEDLTKKIAAGEIPLEQMDVVENQLAEKERMEDLLIRLRSIVKALHLPTSTVDEVEKQRHYLELWQKDSKSLAAEVTEVIEQVEDKTSSLAQAQSSMEAELSLLARYEPILHKIQPLAKQIVTTGAYDSVALLVERRYKSALDMLKKELDQLTHNQCEIVSTDVDEDTTAVIVVFGKKYSEAVHKFLAMENVNQVRLPSDFQDMPFDVAYEQLTLRKAELPAQLEQVKNELAEMSSEWYMKLTTVRDVLVDKIDEISAIPKFGQTEYAFVITGWLPASDVKSFRRSIIEEFGTDVIINQLEIDEREFDETPVSLKNPKWAEPASFAMSYLMGGKPKYGTIDPSIIWAISYPLIFGMIVGDIGYGIVMLAIILWMRLKFKDKPAVQLATGLLGPAATAAILFGFFYGEFFGAVFWEAGWIRTFELLGFTLPYNREHVVQPLMFMALGLGVIQILFGLILGVVNSVRTKHMKHAFVKGGLAGFIVGAVILIIAMVLLNSNPVVQIIGAITMTVGILAVLRWGGIMGFVETLESISNIASYIRIMAVGLSDAIFATAINRMAANDQIPTVVGIVLLLVFHGLHLVLAVFTPTIHALRLNFLEFGGKYYEASKSEYEPFHKTGGEKRA